MQENNEFNDEEVQLPQEFNQYSDVSQYEQHNGNLSEEEPSELLKYTVSTLSILIIVLAAFLFIVDCFAIWVTFASGLDGNFGFPLLRILILPFLISVAVIGFIGSCVKKDLHQKFIHIRMYVIGLGVYCLFSISIRIMDQLFGLLHPVRNTLTFFVGLGFGILCPLLCCGGCMSVAAAYAFKINSNLPNENQTILEKIKNTTKTEKIFSLITVIIVVLFIVGFLIALLIASVRALNPKYVYITKYGSTNCKGRPVVSGSGRAYLNVCENSDDGSASAKYTYSSSGGIRTIHMNLYVGVNCKTTLATLKVEEKKCLTNGDTSQTFLLF
eukprot:gene4095-7383_t